jgi:hypothetical protein
MGSKTMKSKIIIIGDSFCVDRTSPNSWITYLQHYFYNYDILGAGYPGTGWWTHNKGYNATLNELDSKLTENDILIWCHSSPYRLPNDYDVPITQSAISFALNDPRFREIDKSNPMHVEMFNDAKQFYLSKLFSFDFYEWAELSFWKELQLKTSAYKKVIHFFGFPSTNFAHNRNALQSDNAIVVTMPLLILSRSEDPDTIGGGSDTHRVNHFNAHNNRELAKFTIKLIEEVDAGCEIAIDYSTWDIKDNPALKLSKTLEELRPDLNHKN